MVKVSHKQLKVILASGVRKLSPTSVASKLGEYPLFNGFFDLSLFDLDDFWDLANFWLFDLPVFGFICFNPLPPLMSPTLLLASTLAPSISLAASNYNDMIVFNINVSDTAIVLKLLIN